MQSDALPQRPQHRVERLDAVREGGLRQGGQTQRGDGAHLLLLVDQPVLRDTHLRGKRAVTLTLPQREGKGRQTNKPSSSGAARSPHPSELRSAALS